MASNSEPVTAAKLLIDAITLLALRGISKREASASAEKQLAALDDLPEDRKRTLLELIDCYEQGGDVSAFARTVSDIIAESETVRQYAEDDDEGAL